MRKKKKRLKKKKPVVGYVRQKSGKSPAKVRQKCAAKKKVQNMQLRAAKKKWLEKKNGCAICVEMYIV